jgi:pyruvate dehydrogenase E1 component alpha subunit
MTDAPVIELYRQMLRMRRFEEVLAQWWHQGRISGELHLGIGEEGIVAGVLAHLVDGDALALDHRPTPALIGRGTDPAALLFEMVGAPAGLCGGRGGHMHLFDPDRLAASSGIVGASGPMACGFALSADLLRPGRIAVAMFGESAVNQGMMMEAMNLAAVWNLPVLFTVKDNGWAFTTRSNEMTAGGMRARAAGLGLDYRSVDGTDAVEVWRTAAGAIGGIRSGKGPAMLHATCHRPRGHFEHDPLIEMIRGGAAARRELGPMVKGVADRTAGSLRHRVAGLGRVAATAGRMGIHLLARGRDPVARLAGSIDENRAAGVRARVEAEVMAYQAAVRDS